MNIEFWAATDPGKQRSHNEDNFLVDKSLGLFVVADGMGGHAAGEVASSLCVRRVREAVAAERALIQGFDEEADSAARAAVLRLLETAVQTACSAIYERAQRQTDKRGMGTTCTLLLLAGNRGFMAHVGDSRIYLKRQGQVHQLSEDHSLINELVRRGKLKIEQLDESPYRNYANAVTRAVGVYESVEVDTLDFDLLPGDEFLLCSDGLHHYLDKTDSVEQLLVPDSARLATEKLLAFANDGGGHDNITAVVVRLAEQAEDQRAKDVSLRIEALRGMPIFRYLSYKELVRVLNITEVQDYKDTQVIMEEGASAAEMFIILSGKVKVFKGDAFITELEAGDHLGEMGLVEAAPRSARAIADGAAQTLRVPRGEFFEILRNESKLSVKLLWSFVQVLAKRLRKTTADLSGERSAALLPDLTEELLFEEADRTPGPPRKD